MINVCFFSGDITRNGGTERVSSVIANELVKNEQLNICFLSLWEKKQRTFFPLNNEIQRKTLFDSEVSGKRILTYIKNIRKFVKENHIDILIDIDGILDMYSLPALKGLGCKLISWEQFNYYQNPGVGYRKYTRKISAKRADAIIVLTNEDKCNYEKETTIRGRLARIYNPIEKKDHNNKYNLNSKIILSAGRITYQKGFDILVDVAKKVFEKNPNWQWYILGEGEDREKIKQKIKDFRLENNVILKGNVNNIDDFYKNAAMYVLTSRYEGFGLVLTEAKSMGLPCISFKCPAGPSEIIVDNVNGYLIDCFDVEEMAKKINYLIENEDVRKDFSEKSLVETEKFDLYRIIKQWEELLMTL